MLTIKLILETLKVLHTQRLSEYQEKLSSILPPQAPLIFQTPEYSAVSQLECLLYQHVCDLQQHNGPNARMLRQLHKFEQLMPSKKDDKKDYLSLIDFLAPKKYSVDKVQAVIDLLEIIPVHVRFNSTHKVKLNGYETQAEYLVWDNGDVLPKDAFAGDMKVSFNDAESAYLRVKPWGNYLQWEFIHEQVGGSIVSSEAEPTNCFNNFSLKTLVKHDALEEESYPGLPDNFSVDAFTKVLALYVKEKGLDSKRTRMSKDEFTRALKELRDNEPTPFEYTDKVENQKYNIWHGNHYYEFWENSQEEKEPILKWSFICNAFFHSCSSKLIIEGHGEEIDHISYSGDVIKFTSDPQEFKKIVEDDTGIDTNRYYVLLTEYFYFKLFSLIKGQRPYALRNAVSKLETIANSQQKS